MSMTKEEIIKKYEIVVEGGELIAPFMGEDEKELYEMLKAGLSALRPVTREQVERIRGEWVAKVTGVDDMGEQRTITIDERCEYDDRYCSRCGKQSPDNFLNFCGYCGAPMTDEAVDMMLKRMEEIYK